MVLRGSRQTVLPSRTLLWDVKTIWGDGGDYTCPRARDEQSGAVAERAHRVAPDYLAHARGMDRQAVASGHAPPGSTAVLDRLGSYTPVRAAVFGQYAEASSDVHSLISAIARARAVRDARRYGARTEAEALGFFTASIRRRVGVMAAREIARHRLRRVPLIEVPYAVLRDLPARRPPVEVRHASHSTAQDFYQYQLRADPLPPLGGG